MKLGGLIGRTCTKIKMSLLGAAELEGIQSGSAALPEPLRSICRQLRHDLLYDLAIAWRDRLGMPILKGAPNDKVDGTMYLMSGKSRDD